MQFTPIDKRLNSERRNADGYFDRCFDNSYRNINLRDDKEHQEKIDRPA